MESYNYAADLAILHDKTARLFTKQKVPSDYIGDAYAWQHGGSISCSVLPVTDKLTIEAYGPRVQQMLSIHAAPGTAISDGMGVAFTEGAAEPDYTVISVKQRMTHTYALIEAIDVGSQD
jgi:hypothetical protein